MSAVVEGDLSASLKKLAEKRKGDGEKGVRVTKAVLEEKVGGALEKAGGVDVRDAGLVGDVGEGLEGCTGLRSIDFSGNRFRGFGKVECKGVKELLLDRNSIVSLKNVERFVGLQHLSLVANEITEIPVTVNQLQMLKSLNLEGNAISEVKKIMLPNLESLNVSRNRLTKICVDCSFPKLVDLKMSHNHITGFAGLQKLTSLEDLDLAYNNITDSTSDSYANRRATAAMSPFRFCQHLTSVNLRHNHLASISFLPTLPHLTELLLGNNNLGRARDTPTPPTPGSVQRTPSIFDSEIDDAEYSGAEDGGKSPSKQEPSRRRSSAISTTSTRQSKATTSANKSASATAETRRNICKVISEHCPAIEVLDLSHNPHLFPDYTRLSPLSKCATLADLRTVGSYTSEPPSHSAVYGLLPSLEVIDGYSVIRVNRLEIQDLESTDPSNDNATEVVFKRDPSFQIQPTGAWSAPGLRPSTASSDRPQTASGRPLMRPMSSCSMRSGISWAGTEAADEMKELELRLKNIKQQAERRVANLRDALSALPDDVTSIQSAVDDVRSILEGKGAREGSPVRRGSSSSTSPHPPSTPTPERGKKFVRGEGSGCSTPQTLTTKPLKGTPGGMPRAKYYHLQKRSGVGKMTFAEEANIAKNKRRVEEELDARLLHHHVAMMQENKVNVVKQKTSTGAQAGDAAIRPLRKVPAGVEAVGVGTDTQVLDLRDTNPPDVDPVAALDESSSSDDGVGVVPPLEFEEEFPSQVFNGIDAREAISQSGGNSNMTPIIPRTKFKSPPKKNSSKYHQGDMKPVLTIRERGATPTESTADFSASIHSTTSSSSASQQGLRRKGSRTGRSLNAKMISRRQ
eukprot:TRINITY_DN20973_c0_g2_i1.p1 TRINITY_DN20973_c0_g2~~TRINITY_DN20973_c0_g2_i1.p1  ORF type:complete len:883 (+),score=213.53 TRINITY_DN20973_c0_g2_i1:85-2649(+)